jgi:hypothetical protein
MILHYSFLYLSWRLQNSSYPNKQLKCFWKVFLEEDNKLQNLNNHSSSPFSSSLSQNVTTQMQNL